jgi:hypothetical protein
MKTFTVQLSSLVSQFVTHQADYLFDCAKDENPKDHEDNVELFLKDIRNLMCPNRGLVVNTLRRLFSDGFTMMLLAPAILEQLEFAIASQEEISLIVRDGKEVTCILCQAELSW